MTCSTQQQQQQQQTQGSQPKQGLIDHIESEGQSNC
jgi:hypothetical protein